MSAAAMAMVANRERPLAGLVASYRQNGYCAVPSVLPVDEVEAVLQEMDQLFGLQLRRLGRRPAAFEGEATVRANMEALLGADVKAYLAAARHAAKLVSLQRLVACPAITALVEAFGVTTPTIPTMPVVHIMCETLQIPGGYFGISPHQDWPSIQGGLDTITMWVPLIDVDSARFPLQVIPGSHLRGLWEGEIADNALEIRKGFVESDFVSVPVARGDVVIFSGFTVHRTALRDCRGLRIASSTRYENSAESTFVERNYPCAYKRTVERELIHKDFPTQEEVASLYAPAKG